MEVLEYGVKHIKEDEFCHFFKGAIAKEEPIQILNEEILKEEPSEIEAFSKYNNACDESCLEQIQDGDKSELENSKCFFVDENTLLKPNLFNDGIIVKNEDCTDDLSIQITEWETGTIKTEDNIDIVYEDDKPELYDEPLMKIESITSPKLQTDGDQSKSELEDSKGFSVDENTQLKPNLFNDGIIVKNEDCTDDLSIQITEWETETIKTEDNIDIVHEDDKPELFDESLIKIESSTSPELPTDNGGVQHDDAFKEGELEADEDSEKKLLHCDICLQSFKRKIDLWQHKKTHTGAKQFNCEICSKSFSNQNFFSRHLRTHTGKKLFQCKICSKQFTLNSNLKQHIRIHTGIKLFQCKICSKQFTLNSNLKQHIRIHTGIKPFKCKICLKSFGRKGSLLLHESVHTGEKPFQCKICSKQFTRKSNLKVHIGFHSGKKEFRCKICTKSYSLISSLIKHQNNGNCILLVHERAHPEEFM